MLPRKMTVGTGIRGIRRKSARIERIGLAGHPSGAPAMRMASIMRSRCARNTGLSLSPKARTLPIDEILLFGIAAEVGERQHHEGETRGLAALGRRRRRVRKSRLGDVE